jgi:carboxymethylenebutenolidase
MAAASVHIPASDGGSFEAWLSTPPAGRGPAIVLLAEIYNANHWVRSVCDRYAQQGYVVVAPDLYWRQSPGAYLDYTPEDQQRGRALAAGMDLDRFVDDLKATAAWLRARPDCTGRVGTVGYCLGGKLVWIGLARQAVDAGVSYYAVQLADFLDEAQHIDAPLMMHFGSLDHRVPPDLYEKIKGSLAGKRDASTFWYEGADHGFDRNGYPPHHPAASELAGQRTRDFLARHLKENRQP